MLEMTETRFGDGVAWLAFAFRVYCLTAHNLSPVTYNPSPTIAHPYLRPPLLRELLPPLYELRELLPPLYELRELLPPLYELRELLPLLYELRELLPPLYELRELLLYEELLRELLLEVLLLRELLVEDELRLTDEEELLRELPVEDELRLIDEEEALRELLGRLYDEEELLRELPLFAVLRLLPDVFTELALRDEELPSREVTTRDDEVRLDVLPVRETVAPDCESRREDTAPGVR